MFIDIGHLDTHLPQPTQLNNPSLFSGENKNSPAKSLNLENNEKQIDGNNIIEEMVEQSRVSTDDVFGQDIIDRINEKLKKK